MKFFLFFFLLTCGLSAQAQVALPKGNSDKPIEIQSDTLEVMQQDKIALFKGNVEAQQGTMHLKSDEMRVYYKEKQGTKDKTAKPAESPTADLATQNSISKIDVRGNVFLSTPDETAQGDKGLYDVDKSTITLTENVVLTRGKNILKGSWLIYDLKTGHSEMKSDEAVGKDGKKQRVRGIFVPEKAKKP